LPCESIPYCEKFPEFIPKTDEPNAQKVSVNLDKMTTLINNKPIYWNNYFIWSYIKPKIIMYKNGINFNTKGGTMIEDYNKLINEAVNVSILNTDYFVSNYVNK
jgi:hypothetical protein